jgi:hypothetical protein
VDHLSVEVEEGSGFERAYAEPASSHVENEMEGIEVVDVVPIVVAVSVGAAGDPPPVTW